MSNAHNIQPIDRPRDFDVSELLFSVTDRRSDILCCNDVFCRISGYEPDEVLQKPHDLIRHPDMPRAVFKLLWDHIREDRPVGVYLKNMAKTGEHYWVYALIVPVKAGYLSIRMKPTSDLLPMIEELYGRTLDDQQSFGNNSNDGMLRSGEKMLNELTALGFDSYDDFMAQALHKEAASRQAQISSEKTASASVQNSLDDVSALIELRDRLCNTSTYFESLALEIRRVAINASVVAARLTDGGLALGVISQEVSRVAELITEESSKLRDQVDALRDVLYGASFTLSFIGLLNETRSDFKTLGGAQPLTSEEQRERFGMSLSELDQLLEESSREAMHRCNANLESLTSTLSRFNAFVDALAKILMTLQFGYVTGKSISVSIPGGHEFSMLLEDLVGSSRQARTELTKIKAALRKAPMARLDSAA